MKIRVYLVLSAMSKVTLISIRNIEKLGPNMVQYKKNGTHKRYDTGIFGERRSGLYLVPVIVRS